MEEEEEEKVEVQQRAIRSEGKGTKERRADGWRENCPRKKCECVRERKMET